MKHYIIYLWGLWYTFSHYLSISFKVKLDLCMSSVLPPGSLSCPFRLSSSSLLCGPPSFKEAAELPKPEEPSLLKLVWPLAPSPQTTALRSIQGFPAALADPEPGLLPSWALQAWLNLTHPRIACLLCQSRGGAASHSGSPCWAGAKRPSIRSTWPGTKQHWMPLTAPVPHAASCCPWLPWLPFGMHTATRRMASMQPGCES